VHGFVAQLSIPPQPSDTMPAQRVPQAAAIVFLVQQVVDEEHEVLQQLLQFVVAFTVSPSGTHVTQFIVVSSHAPPEQALAEQSTVPPHPSEIVPAHCVPHAERVFGVQHVVVAVVEHLAPQQPGQKDTRLTRSPSGTHVVHIPVVTSQTFVHVFIVQSTVPVHPSGAVPVHIMPQAAAMVLGVQLSIGLSVGSLSAGTSAGVSVDVSFGGFSVVVSIGESIIAVSAGASVVASGVASIMTWSALPPSVVTSMDPSGPPSTSEAGNVTSNSHPMPVIPTTPARLKKRRKWTVFVVRVLMGAP